MRRTLIDDITINSPMLAEDIMRGLAKLGTGYCFDCTEVKNEYGVVTQVNIQIYACKED